MIDDEEIREIQPFMVKNMPKSYTALHIGAPGSGKTFTMQSLAYMQSHIYPVGQATCGTEATQGSFAPLFGNLFVTHTFSGDIQDSATSRQVKCKNLKCPTIESFHIVDDIGYNKKNLKHKNVIESIKNGTQWLYRAYHLGIHSAKEVHDELSGFSYVFVYFEKENSLRRLLYNKYFSVYLHEFKDFCSLMDDLLGGGKKGCLVIDVKKSSTVLEECVHILRCPYWTWPKSEDPKKLRPYPEGWRFGCQQFKDWNDSRLNREYVPEFIMNMQK